MPTLNTCKCFGLYHSWKGKYPVSLFFQGCLPTYQNSYLDLSWAFSVYMLWFNFILGIILFSFVLNFKVINIYYHTIKTKENKI